MLKALKETHILREINLAIVLNGYAAVALNSISMFLISYNWFKTRKCDYIKFERNMLLDTRLTSIYVSLPFYQPTSNETAKWSKFF